MLHKLVIKVTKFLVSTEKSFSTVDKNILGAPMSNRVKVTYSSLLKQNMADLQKSQNKLEPVPLNLLYKKLTTAENLSKVEYELYTQSERWEAPSRLFSLYLIKSTMIFCKTFFLFLYPTLPARAKKFTVGLTLFAYMDNNSECCALPKH